MAIVQASSTWASATAVSTEDYDQVGSVDSPTKGGERDISTLSTGSYQNFTLNATGLGWIARSGETKPSGFVSSGITALGWREGNDVDDTAISQANTRNFVVWYPADRAGTSQDPKLVVEHAIPQGGGTSPGTLQNITFAYDANGNITAITDNSDTGAGKAVTYTYDGLNRLISASTTAASSTPYRHQFAYSMLGNITGMSTSSATSTYTYAETGYANPHAVTSVGGTSYSYDNSGNVTAIGSLDYTWDWRNRLASAERSGGGVTTYGYDYTGQRVFKATGSATTSYPNRYYNVASSSLAATTTKHIFSPDGTLLAVVVGSGTTTASTTYLHPDHLGGTNVATDEDGEVVQTLDYYPYGSQRIATGSFDEQRGFIGEEYDAESTLNYLNARYYEGSRGQFMSQDPVSLALGDPARVREITQRELREVLADPQALNSYAYARNNPILLTDPSGKCFEPLSAIVCAFTVYGFVDTGIEYLD